MQFYFGEKENKQQANEMPFKMYLKRKEGGTSQDSYNFTSLYIQNLQC